ncbi:MAG TPA: hypothetical protein VIZ18_11070 [Ktedonobacteraceae bacterium]
MAIFGYYFITNMLQGTGWPRRQGLLKKEVVNTLLLETIENQMINWAAAIGAGRPNLALQLIAFCYQNKDWNGDNAPEIKSFIESERERIGSEIDPYTIMAPLKFQKYGETIPAKVIEDLGSRNAFEQIFMDGLLYGLGNPKRYEAWYEADLKDFEKKKPTYNRMGLQVGEKLPSLSENYVNAEEIVHSYEQAMGVSLPTTIPHRLIADVKTVRSNRL